MARVEQDREDIVREASALRPRAEIRLSDEKESLVFGFRQSGGLSLFFGPDPVYQFNSEGELRRAFVDGQLYKSISGKLQKLDRQRDADQVTLWQSDLSDIQQAAFLERLQFQCNQLAAMIGSNHYELIEEFPKDCNSVKRLREFLSNMDSPPRIAAKPNVA